MDDGGGGDRAPSDERVWKWKARRASMTAENATVCETHTGMQAMGVADRETTTGGRIVVREGHNESKHVSLAPHWTLPPNIPRAYPWYIRNIPRIYRKYPWQGIYP